MSETVRWERALVFPGKRYRLAMAARAPAPVAVRQRMARSMGARFRAAVSNPEAGGRDVS